MKKVILDLSVPENKKELHEYIAGELSFPDYYGKNLDALYDMLTDISEPTAIGLFPPTPDFNELDMDLMVYIDQLCDVFRDAEKSNPELAVIFGDIVENLDPDEDYPGTDEFDDLLGPDPDGSGRSKEW